MKKIPELIQDTIDLRVNPTGVQRVIYDAMETMLDGEYDVPNPSNPFAFVLEAACFTATAGMMRNETLTRQLYPSLSRTYEDLYRHMSDVDYMNRFSTPGELPLALVLDADEVRERAMPDGAVRKVTIPRETMFHVDGYYFTLQYPIDIRVMAHGGFQVMYDTSIQSPVQTLDTNVVEYKTFKAPANMDALAHRNLLAIYIPIKQMRIDSYTEQLNRSTGFMKSYETPGKFFYCRVYTSKDNSEWSEIKTTHSAQVFDEDKATAVLRVVENAVEVQIPQVYFTKEIIGRNIRVDVYTTEGDVFLNFQRFKSSDYVVRWEDLSRFESPYINPFRSLVTKLYAAEGPLTGGSDGLTFEQLRDRVIYGALGGDDRKTQKQLELDLQNKGYSLIKEIDHITNRQYLAVRAIQRPSNRFIASAIGCTVKPLQETFNSVVATRSVFDNGLRATIDSGTLFKIESGVLNLVTNSELSHLDSLNKENLAQAYQQNDYLYNPYHLVLDLGEDKFDTRVYYLDKPKTDRREFIEDNDTTLLQVGSSDIHIERIEDGYRLLLLTRSSDEYKDLDNNDVHVQLLFTPPTGSTPVGINGVLIGQRDNGERLFEFILQTNFDVDKHDRLMLTNFKMLDNSNITMGINLRHEMDIVYVVSNYNADGMTTSAIDNRIRRFMLPSDAVAVSQERVRVRFGTPLKQLWRKARVVVDSLGVRRYEEDIPEVWKTNVYETDPVTGYFKYQVVDGKLERILLHTQGDVVMQDGEVVYAHRAGDVKIVNGEPDFVGGRQKLLQFDVMLFEAKFLIAETSLAVNYRNTVTDQLVSWITTDMEGFSKELLEHTSLWFHPTNTVGDVSVIVNERLESVLSAGQSFNVVYYLDRRNHGNLELRSKLNEVAVNAIATFIGGTTVRINDMLQRIRQLTGDEVIDVSMNGLGNAGNLELVTLMDPSTQLSVAKRLTVLADGTISLLDDVSVSFEVHRE